MRRLRVSGNTPAILYGNNKDVMALQLETNSFLKTLFQISRKNAVVNLAINGDETRHVMMRDIQTDPVTDSLIHADFLEIDLGAPKRFTVPVEFTGVAKGVDLGGELVVHSSSVVIEGLPLEVPDAITIEISDLGIGDSIAFSDVELTGGLSMVTDGATLCIEVIALVA